MWINTIVLVLMSLMVVFAVDEHRPKIKDETRGKRNLQYSISHHYSGPQSFRLERKIATGPQLLPLYHQTQFFPGPRSYTPYHKGRPSFSNHHPPPYAVQMEPLIHYSQRDPLLDSNNIISPSTDQHGEDLLTDNNHLTESIYGPPHVHHQPQIHTKIIEKPVYIKEPEPIIEIIIKESNVTLPPPPPPPSPPPKKKEQVQVFYVKYKKNPNGHGKNSVIYDKPIPAISPPIPDEEEEHEPPPPAYHHESATAPPPPSTTLRTIIKPDSEVYHSPSGIKVTFGKEGFDYDKRSSKPEDYPSFNPDKERQKVQFPAEPKPIQPQARQLSSFPPSFQRRPTNYQQSATNYQRQPQPYHPFNSQSFRASQPQYTRQNPSQQYSTLPRYIQNQPRQPPPRPPLPQFQQPRQPVPYQPFDTIRNQHQHVQFRPETSFPSLTQPSNPVPPNHQPHYKTSQFQPEHRQPPQYQHSQLPPHQTRPQFSQPLPQPQPQPHFNQPQPQPQPQPHFNQPQPQPQSQPHFNQPHHTQFNNQQQHSHLTQTNIQYNTHHQPQQQQQPQSQHHQNLNQLQLPPGGELIHSLPRFEQHISLIEPNKNQQSPQQQPLSSQHSQNHHQTQIQHQQPQQQQQQQQQSSQPTQSTQSLSQSEFNSKIQNQFQQAAAFQDFIRQNNYYQANPTASPNNQQSFTGSSNHHSNPSPSPYYQSTPAPTTTTTTAKPTTPAEPSTTTKDPKILNAQLPDEVPDDLREQLLSSGILNNADISILDYDKVGDIPLSALPPDQLANFYNAGGAQQLASAGSDHIPVYSNPNSKSSSDNDDDNVETSDDHDEETAASEIQEVKTNPEVQMKVVHYDPQTERGQQVQESYVKDDATQVDPVLLNDQKYNRYLPLKVSGAQFPIPDVPELKGKKITSVVVLAPVTYEFSKQRRKRQSDVELIQDKLLKELLKNPTAENYKKFLEREKNTKGDQQAVILLVAGESPNKEIFMYDIATRSVSRLDGELSSAFVEAAEANAAKDLEDSASELVEERISYIDQNQGDLSGESSVQSEQFSDNSKISDATISDK